jgi:hypothetical protein
VLWLCVKNSVWMQQMTFMLGPIKTSINKKFKAGFVKEIRLTLDRKSTPQMNNENFRENLKKFIK